MKRGVFFSVSIVVAVVICAGMLAQSPAAAMATDIGHHASYIIGCQHGPLIRDNCTIVCIEGHYVENPTYGAKSRCSFETPSRLTCHGAYESNAISSTHNHQFAIGARCSPIHKGWLYEYIVPLLNIFSK